LGLFGSQVIAQQVNLEKGVNNATQTDTVKAQKVAFALSPEYYKQRYNGGDLTYKVVDNKGNGFDALYGARNLRPILYGVAYRGVQILLP
jgi:hypothetical protein